MSAPSRPSEPESPFEYCPFGDLYLRALRDVADRRLDESSRKAAARALAFLLRERFVDERVATDVLTAIRGSLDVSKIVRTLLLGLRDALGDHEKITEWTWRAAGRAHAQRHVGSFVSAIHVLVGLRDFDGALPTNWQLLLIRAAEDPKLRRRLLHIADEYARRFGSGSQWVRKLRARYVIRGVRVQAAHAEAGGGVP